jgi:uncharacterized membrane protein/mono/diheme cytochrome c family protein
MAFQLDDPDVWLAFLGRLHPLLVHFPLALCTVAFALEVIFGRGRSPGSVRTVLVCLFLGVLGGSAAGGSGWILAEQAGASPERMAEIDLHRWVAVAAVALGWLALLLGLAVRKRDEGGGVSAFRFALTGCALATAAAGHLGAELVWGKGFMLEPFKAPQAAPEDPQARQSSSAESPPAEPSSAVPPSDAPTPAGGEAAQAAPGPPKAQLVADAMTVFADHCVECHGMLRRKAGLRLDDPSELFEGPEEDWLVRPGDPEESWLYLAVTLPLDHPDRMPKDADPLDADAVAAIEAWIAGGAPLPEPAPTAPEPTED